MMGNIRKGFDDLKGTGSELRDNRAYDTLVDKVGDAGAQRLIQSKLQERGLTLEEWGTYRKVRTVLHRSPLKVNEEVKEVNDLANKAIDDSDGDDSNN